jgi:hypothetical protein
VRRVVGLLILAVLASAAPAFGAFPGANGRIVVMREEPSIAEVTPTAGPYPTPTASPGPTENGLYAMDPDGGALTRMTNNRYVFPPTAAPDGRSVLTGFAGSLCSYTVAANAETTCVGGTGGIYAMDPSWSPDGAKIVFASNITQDATGYYGPDLFLSNADGTGSHTLLHGYAANSPAWSPDGSRIAFVADPGDVTDGTGIYTVRPDGTDVRKVTAPLYGGHLDWAPDGSRLAYDDGSQIHSVAADGSDDRILGPGTDPAYSPDGTQIAAIVLTPDESSPIDQAQVATLPATGGPETFTSGAGFHARAVTWARVPDPLPTITPTPPPVVAATPTATPPPVVVPRLAVIARQLADRLSRAGILAGMTTTPSPSITTGTWGLAVLGGKHRRETLARGHATGTQPLTVRATKAGRRVLAKRARVTIRLSLTAAGARSKTVALRHTLR